MSLPPVPPLNDRSINLWGLFATVSFLAAVLAAHGWLTVHHFAGDSTLQAVWSDEPILSGRHALHLYHGHVGAEAFRNHRGLRAYDPGFFAGYPKTALFDSGSRPAEVTQLLAGGFSVQGYKIGLFTGWCLVPFLVAAGSWYGGLGRGAACLSALLAATLLSCDPGRNILENGDLDLVLGVGLAVCGAGLLICYRQRPGVIVWTCLTTALCLLTFLQPLILVALLPALVVYGSATLGRHGLTWHLGLASAVASGPILNRLSLYDWFDSWWMLSCPGMDANEASLQQLIELNWQALLPNDLSGQIIAGMFAVGGMGGALILLACRRSLAGRVFGALLLAWLAIYVLAAFLGESSEHGLGEPGDGIQQIELPIWNGPALLLGAMLCGIAPLAGGLQAIFQLSRRITSSVLRAIILWAGVAAAAVWLLHGQLTPIIGDVLGSKPLHIGLPSEVEATLEALKDQTSEAARILWEEEAGAEHWSPLLPLWTGRSFVGGLPARIEHASIRLAEGRLAGRALEDWTDAELMEYCRTYNVGWLVCRSPAALARFGKWDVAVEVAELPTGHWLFLLRRQPTFLLRGEGNLLHCDHRGITLTDLQPVDGVVDLSFHYHPATIPSNDRVIVDRLNHGFSSVPLLRLRLLGPVSRLTLYWQE